MKWKFEHDRPLIVKNTTDSTDSLTGGLIVKGGVGIDKNVNVGASLLH